MPNNRHIFSIFVTGLDQKIDRSAKHASLRDRDLWNRITKILRAKEGNQIILFDDSLHANIKLLDKTFDTKDVVHFDIEGVEGNKPIEPLITLACPILKKAAFEDAVYFSTALGVHKIIPVITNKVQRQWGGPKELQRLKKISIAAAEQSKNFFIPIIEEPIQFNDLLGSNFVDDQDTKVSFSITGNRLLDVFSGGSSLGKIFVILGPEGDFTNHEYEQLEKSGFQFSSLVSTTLKSEHAVAVGIGSIRSLLQ